ncbi:threonine synthase [Burkholderia multivorans]|uniref:Threonine synthase n=1 Tax=Burkholderia multivorans TaxID=87883 RepID=A0A8E2RTC1_9BURK|nr:threonine synthase [Burkholderia multivorans]AJY18498.1 threonine synthase [Burkholderia multivorans ATCC BAA-247]AVR22269.1 threonine synthase [Burkholderia multivorans]EJO63404.1 threonine synthase [Burkholderia multivorans ATCC BAA-247]KOE26569.1 threonine synthase [Burkholderia multivorans R-20526]MBU9150007.1 threonine synthase [Burkholderia multivorans]
MNYISTRGAGIGERHTFSDILLAGLAKDGGLYLPAEYPQVSADELARWRALPYADLAFEILSKFCDDVPADDLRAIARRTYTADVYRHTRHGENAHDITPLKTLGTEHGAPLALLELSNGPTLAFKDMAMQLLGNLFEYTLAKHGETLNILGATSGDTGSAAEYAMRGKAGVRVFMLSPHKKMSAFQTAQMYSLQDPNIFNLAVEGVFDDCQDIVKAVSNDHAFKAQHKIGTVNSINWARVVAQVVYYFKGYFAATRSNDERVSFTVPSGNFGNVCAGHIARMMGLPIAKLVVATNENDVLDEFFRTGAYRVRSAENTYHTSSPSMDISKASNFERFVFDLLGRDPARVMQLFRDVEEKGGFDLAASGDFTRVAEFGFVSGRSSHADRIATIRDVFSRYGTTIDTHTADGVKVAREHLDAGVPMIVLETAQPIKFGETIREALEREPERPAAFDGLESLPQRFEVVKADAQQVKDFIAAHTRA